MIDLHSHLHDSHYAPHSNVNIARAIALTIALAVLAMTSATSGEFYGSIKADGKVLPKGIKIDITSPAKTYTTETDAYGSYRLYVTEKGKCELKVYYKNHTPSIQVFSYPKSTRYDFSIEKKDTVLFLKRK